MYTYISLVSSRPADCIVPLTSRAFVKAHEISFLRAMQQHKTPFVDMIVTQYSPDLFLKALKYLVDVTKVRADSSLRLPISLCQQGMPTPFSTSSPCYDAQITLLTSLFSPSR